MMDENDRLHETHRFEVGDRRARGDHTHKKLRAGGITWRRAAGVSPSEGRLRLEDIEVVLVQSSSAHDRWILPAGTIENGETAIEAGLREIEEECGVTPRRHAGDSPSLERSPLPSPLLLPARSTPSAGAAAAAAAAPDLVAPESRTPDVVVAVVKPNASGGGYAIVPSASSEQVAGRTLHVVNGASFVDVTFLGRFFDKDKNAENYMFSFEIGHIADTWIEQPRMNRRFANGAQVRAALAWRPATLDVWDAFERHLQQQQQQHGAGPTTDTPPAAGGTAATESR